MATCEWNPERNRSAFVGEQGHAEATVICGADGAYHLCASCAALPRFARFKKRPLTRRVPERVARKLNRESEWHGGGR